MSEFTENDSNAMEEKNIHKNLVGITKQNWYLTQNPWDFKTILGTTERFQSTFLFFHTDK